MKDDRDPKALGETLLQFRDRPDMRGSTLHHAHDDLEGLGLQVERHSSSASVAELTQALYRQEMTDLAASGDAAARIVCHEHGWAYRNMQAEDEEESVKQTLVRLQCGGGAEHGEHVWSRLAPGTGTDPQVERFLCPGIV